MQSTGCTNSSVELRLELKPPKEDFKGEPMGAVSEQVSSLTCALVETTPCNHAPVLEMTELRPRVTKWARHLRRP